VRVVMSQLRTETSIAKAGDGDRAFDLRPRRHIVALADPSMRELKAQGQTPGAKKRSTGS